MVVRRKEWAQRAELGRLHRLALESNERLHLAARNGDRGRTAELVEIISEAEERGRQMQLASSFGTWLSAMWMMAACAGLLNIWLAYRAFGRH